MRWVSYTRKISDRKGEENPSDVISRQNKDIEEFMKKHGWEVSKKYSDRKNQAAETAAFEQMVADGIDRKFDGVVVSSVYRCGQNHWQAEEILQDIFFPAGIHFAVVEDDFISIGKTKEEVAIYFNDKRRESHTRDLAEKKACSEAAGIFTHGADRYGYVLNEDKLGYGIDEKSAAVVKRIFELFLEGENYADIARILNRDGVTPVREQLLKNRGKEKTPSDSGKWAPGAVKTILQCPFYKGVGHRVAGGEEATFPVPPIVSEKDFAAAQEMVAKRSRPPYTKGTDRHSCVLLSKMIFCKETGEAMHCIKDFGGSGKFVYAFKEYCPENAADIVTRDAVLSLIRDAVVTASVQAARIKRMLAAGEGWEFKEVWLSPLRERARQVYSQMDELSTRRFYLYSRGGDPGDFTEEDFKTRMSALDRDFNGIMDEVKKIDRAYSQTNPWLKKFAGAKWPEDVTHKDLYGWVCRVLVDRELNVEVILRENEWKQMFPDIWLDEGVVK